MAIYFDAGSCDFIDDAQTPPPPGAVLVNAELYAQLQEWRDSGMPIVAGPDGQPLAALPPPPDPVEPPPPVLAFSPATGGFYRSDFHDEFPADAVEITAAEHEALLQAQMEGKRIEAGPDGRPVAADRPPPSAADLAAAARVQRDRLLAACDWTQVPDSPLDAAAKAEWASYRQALRDVPEQPGFPSTVTWPEPPASLSPPAA